MGLWLSVMAVAAGGLIGSAARIGIDRLIPASTDGFPTTVLVVNLVGSFFIGLYLARRERAISRPLALQFWAIGVLGSFTTFSAFSVDLVELLAASRPLTATIYIGASVIGGLALAATGQRVGAVIR